MKKVLASALMACAMAWAGNDFTQEQIRELEKINKGYSEAVKYCAAFSLKQEQEMMTNMCKGLYEGKRRANCIEVYNGYEYLVGSLKENLQICRKGLK